MAEQVVEFDKLKKDELIAMAKELEAKVNGLMELDTRSKSGLINIGGLWAKDRNGEPYKDKNDDRIWIGEIRQRVMMRVNPFKTVDNNQPQLRIAALPYRPQPDQDSSDVYDELDGGGDAENPLL